MKKIKFDSQEWTVNYINKENDDNMGRLLLKKGIIEIDSSMPESIQKATLFHECTHLVLLQLGENELNANEKFVEVLSNAYYRLLKDNKGLIE